MNRKFLLEAVAILFILILLVLPVVEAIAKTTYLKSPGNMTNHSRTISLLNCTTNVLDVLNVTFWYNATGVARDKLTYVANTSVNQKSFSVTNVDISSFTDATSYTIWCQAINQTPTSYKENSTYYNITDITLDSTAPTVTLHGYANATAKMNTAQLTLNVSISDTISGILDGARCVFDVNGTNQTVAITKTSHTFGWCNSSRLNLTNHADDNRLIRLYVNDTVNNKRLNNTRYVLIDTTDPDPVGVCNPDTVARNSALTCTCTGTDAFSGIASHSADAVVETSASGAFTYTCGATDVAGNSASEGVTYTVLSSATIDSSSGSSSSSSGSVVKSTTVQKITAGVVSVVKNFDEETGLKEIQIEVSNDAQNVKVIVTQYDNKPAAVSVEKSGEVYQYLQINVTNVTGKLEKATIISKIEKSWITENEVDKANLALFKFDENAKQWNELTTTYDSEDENYYYYASEVTSFSYFAIGEKSLVGNENGAETIAEEITPSRVWMWIGIAAGVLILAGIVIFFIKKRE